MLLACRLKITFTFSLKLIISILVQLQHLLLPSLIVTTSQVRVGTPLPLRLCCISGLGPEGLRHVFTMDKRGEGAINPYERSCSCAWGHSPPHAREGHKVARGMCRWGCRWYHARSPVDGKGRLVPTTWVSLSTAETVKAPARMPAHIRASTPSHGGREGIDGTGVSHRPEAYRRIASYMYYSYCRNRKKYTETIDRTRGAIFIAILSGRTTRWQCRLPPAECWG
jgi:hypothetical protein